MLSVQVELFSRMEFAVCNPIRAFKILFVSRDCCKCKSIHPCLMSPQPGAPIS